MNRTASARLGRRAAIGVTAAAMLATLVGWSTSSPASAAGLLASTTALTASITNDGQYVNATITVRIGNNKNGLGITPSGTVTFGDNVGDNLGSVAVPSCLLKPCTATYAIPTSRFSDDVERLRATYSGDLLLKTSSAVVPLSLQICDGDGCWGDVAAGNAEMQVQSPDSDQGYIISNFGGAGLPCGVTGGGPVGHVVGVNLNGDKEIYYMLTGPGAKAYADMLYNGQFDDEFPPNWFCYVSQDPFQAWSTDGYHTDFPPNWDSYGFWGDAPQIVGGAYDGYYVGLLGQCPSEIVLGGGGDSPGYDTVQPHNEGDGITGPDGPCIEDYSLYQNSDHGNQWELSVDLVTPPGDPFLGGLKLLAPKKH